MMVKLKFYLYGAEIVLVPATDLVPRKGEHVWWNGMLLEVGMVVWTQQGSVHLYLAREPFDNPPPPGLEEPPRDASWKEEPCDTPPT